MTLTPTRDVEQGSPGRQLQHRAPAGGAGGVQAECCVASGGRVGGSGGTKRDGAAIGFVLDTRQQSIKAACDIQNAPGGRSGGHKAAQLLQGSQRLAHVLATLIGACLDLQGPASATCGPCCTGPRISTG